MALTAREIQDAYVTFFNRAADTEGFTYWTSYTGSISDLYATFAQQTEYTSVYGGKTAEEQITTVYQNLFNRAPDAEGLAYWKPLVEAGTITLANLALTVNRGAQGTDVTALTAKIDTAITETEAAIAANLPGQTFTLTTSADELTTTSSADTISGVVSALSSENTLNVLDVIDGGEGTDTLNVNMTTNFAGFTADKGSMKGVEVVNLTNGSVGIAREFDASGATGIETIKIDAANGVINVKDLASLAAVEISGLKTATDFTVAYDAKSTVVTSTTAKDAQSLKVTDLGTAETKADAADQKYVTVKIANVESLTVESAGTENYLNLSGVDSAASVTVAGAANTDVTAVSAATTAFDASAVTGNVTADLTGAAAGKLKTVATGAGNDKVTVDLNDLTVNAAITGGAGTDSLTINDGAATTAVTLQPTMSGFEKVTLDALGGALILSGKNVSDLAEIALKGGSAGVTVAGGPADLVVSTTGANALSGAFTTDSASSVTINTAASAASAKAKTADAVTDAQATDDFIASKAATVTVNVGAYTTLANDVVASEATSVALNVASGLGTDGKTETSNYTGEIVAAKATSVTIDAAKLGGTVTVAAAVSANVKTGANDSTLKLDAAKLENLTVDAGKGLDMSNSVLTAVQVANLTTAAFLDMTGENLDAASSVTVGGAGTNSQATFGTIGKSTNDYGLTVVATGLAKNLATGAIDAGNGALSVDVKDVTGTVTLASLDANLNVTLDASSNAKAVTVTNATTSTEGSITINASGALDTVTTGNLDATKGTVTVDASGAAKQVNIGVISGKSVVVNAAGALTGVKINNGSTSNTDINAGSSVTYTGANLVANGADIEATATSTALTVALSGGIKDDAFTVKGGAKQTSITVSGDLDIGSNTLTVTLADSDADTQTVSLADLKNGTNTVAIATETDDIIVVTGSAGTADTITLGSNQDYTAAAHKLTFTGIENLTVDDTTAASKIFASNVTGTKIKMTGAAANDVLVLVGTDAGETIDLSTLDVSHSGNDVNLTITAGKGNDIIKLSEGVDLIEFSGVTDALNGSDTIGTVKSTDKYLFAKNGSDSVALINADNAGVLTLATTTALATEGTTIAVADNKLYVAEVAAKATVDSVADIVTALADDGVMDAVDIAVSAEGYLIVGGADDDTTHYIYGFKNDTTAAIVASELTLVGTVTTDVTNGLAGLATAAITFA